MSERIYMVSVVRDEAMYEKCIGSNPYCRDAEKVILDNRTENLPIPERYNRFLDSFTGDGWVVFCHEDWMPLEPLELEHLDRNCLWGPIGAILEVCEHTDFIHISGEIQQCRKDGRMLRRNKGTWKDGRTDTFDCQCIIVHSSLLREKELRFDNRLLFDLYAEDFCAQAWQKGVPSRIFPVKCRHYSGGTIGERFWKGLSYLREKYRDCPKRFPTPVGRRNSFGGDQAKPILNYRRTPWARLRYYRKK